MIAVKFSTSVCPQCVQQAELLKKWPLNIDLINIVLDVDDISEDAIDAFDISSVPSIIIFNEFNKDMSPDIIKKNELMRFNGLTAPTKINKWLEEYFG